MTRRLAAIMFTDIAGYTALSQRDEPAAMRLLQDQERLVRGLLEVHQGRLVKSMGDGLLLEFPNALDAVACAVDLQRHIGERNAREPSPELRVRIGIHLGDVQEAGSDILGDAVNVASRIEPLAEPGGICLSAQVYDQVRHKVALPLESLGSKELKGVREPTVVYRVVLPSESDVGSRPGPPPLRLAVLPLTNMSPDPNDEYFADGLTEEITSTVSKVPELSVISRTSVMRFKNQTKPMSEIVHELGAGTILEGSVRKAGNRVRVAVQLIDAAADRHLWAENYDRSLDDIFAIQSEIAEQVARALKVRLLDSDKDQLARVPTEVTEAHLLYMKGRFHQQRGRKVEFETAIDFFEQAVQKDPRYARAYAAIAIAYAYLGLWDMVPAPEAIAKAEGTARKALEFDPSLAEAHIGLSLVQYYGGNLTAAVESMERAMALDPNLPTPHLQMGYIFAMKGQPEMAVREVRKGLELDPLSAATIQEAADTLLFAGHPELALPLAKKGLELDPEGSYAHWILGLSYTELGRFEEGVEELQKTVELSGRSTPAELSSLAYVLNRAGRVNEARKIIAELLGIYEKRGTGAAAIAYAYASVGDADRAFEWLEKGFREGSAYARLFVLDLGFKTLSTDPRFEKFLEKVGLPPRR
jgi:TolB-like protein/class 3 adenylate cyclase/Flp pilus assembly protein TadD